MRKDTSLVCRLFLPINPKLVAVFFILAVSLSGTLVHAADVLIYRGPGACEGCSEAPERLAKSLQLVTQYVSATEISEEFLNLAQVYIQPGGNALDLVKYIDEPHMELLRKFIKDGGTYVGICAGAFFADAKVDNGNTIPGLALIPGETYDFLPDPKATVIPVNWQGEVQPMYFQGGPGFRLSREAAPKVEILASYPDSSPAAIQFRYGAGKVILVGPHPEATPQWFKDDGLAVPKGHNNKVAQDIILRAIGAK